MRARFKVAEGWGHDALMISKHADIGIAFRKAKEASLEKSGVFVGVFTMEYGQEVIVAGFRDGVEVDLMKE